MFLMSVILSLFLNQCNYIHCDVFFVAKQATKRRETIFVLQGKYKVPALLTNYYYQSVAVGLFVLHK